MRLKFWRRGQEDEEQDPKKVVEVVFAQVVPLDPTKRYVIIVDRAAVSKEAAHQLLDGLREMGVKHGVALMTDGDPTTAVQIVET